MKISILIPGKFKNSEYKDIISTYLKRSQHYCNAELVELPVSLKNKSPEDEALLKFLSNKKGNFKLVLLNEKGKNPKSTAFAEMIEKWKDSGTSEIFFAIGGAHEYGTEVQKLPHFALSLSAMTMAHELAATVLAEQLYRALTIIAKHPYHNE